VATISEVQKDKTGNIYFEISWNGGKFHPVGASRNGRSFTFAKENCLVTVDDPPQKEGANLRPCNEFALPVINSKETRTPMRTSPSGSYWPDYLHPSFPHF